MTIGVWVFYFLGQFFHFALKIDAAVKSNINGIITWSQYIRLRWVNLAARVFANLVVFMLVWDNPSLIELPALNMTMTVKLALSGIIGLAMDSILDKVAAKIPWLQREIPRTGDTIIGSQVLPPPGS